MRKGRGLQFRGRRKRNNRTTYFAPNDWNVVDDVTGFVRKRSECQLTWDNLLVAKDQYDPKQPQLDLRGKPDRPAVPLARTESPIVFATDVSPEDL